MQVIKVTWWIFPHQDFRMNVADEYIGNSVRIVSLFPISWHLGCSQIVSVVVKNVPRRHSTYFLDRLVQDGLHKIALDWEQCCPGLSTEIRGPDISSLANTQTGDLPLHSSCPGIIHMSTISSLYVSNGRIRTRVNRHDEFEKFYYLTSWTTSYPWKPTEVK